MNKRLILPSFAGWLVIRRPLSLWSHSLPFSPLTQGAICWVAAIFITMLAFAMLRYKGWETKWERKLQATAAKKVRLPETARRLPQVSQGA